MTPAFPHEPAPLDRIFLDVDVVVNTGAVIGESPTWVAAERALYWIDVKAPALHRYATATGEHLRWPVTSDLGAFCLTHDGAAIVALRQGIHRLELHDGTLELLTPAPFETQLFRFNEGACDSAGRFWIGVMFDPVEGSPPPQKESLFSFTLDDGLRHEPDASELHNGMAWSRDGTRFYLSHSVTGDIHIFEFDPIAGRLGARTAFATVPKATGIPDGAAVDRDDGYWCAIHGGGRIRRFKSDGSVDCDVMLPVSQPTMCAFGGDELDLLYVTSAAHGLTDDQKQAEPLAGAVLCFRPGVKGIEQPAFVR